MDSDRAQAMDLEVSWHEKEERLERLSPEKAPSAGLILQVPSLEIAISIDLAVVVLQSVYILSPCYREQPSIENSRRSQCLPQRSFLCCYEAEEIVLS